MRTEEMRTEEMRTEKMRTEKMRTEEMMAVGCSVISKPPTHLTVPLRFSLTHAKHNIDSQCRKTELTRSAI